MANKANRNESGVLLEKMQLFAEMLKQVEEMLIDRRKKNGDSKALQTIEEFGNVAVELINQLRILAETPRHMHGASYRTDALNYSQNPTYNQNDHFSQYINNSSEGKALQERMYRIGKDLIISTSGQFAFRPQSCLLLLAVGQIKLSEIESKSLHDWMKYDYQLS